MCVIQLYCINLAKLELCVFQNSLLHKFPRQLWIQKTFCVTFRKGKWSNNHLVFLCIAGGCRALALLELLQVATYLLAYLAGMKQVAAGLLPDPPAESASLNPGPDTPLAPRGRVPAPFPNPLALIPLLYSHYPCSVYGLRCSCQTQKNQLYSLTKAC